MKFLKKIRDFETKKSCFIPDQMIGKLMSQALLNQRCFCLTINFFSEQIRHQTPPSTLTKLLFLNFRGKIFYLRFLRLLC